MGNKNTAIKQNITQVILIVFSVVLGLYLSERIEERKKKQESEELLSTIKSEVKDNIKLVEDWSFYHQDIAKNLDSLSKDAAFVEEFKKDKYIFFEKLLTRGNFIGRTPANDAWDIAKSHPLIVNIDYDKLLILSKVYNQQEIAFEPGIKMFELFDSKDINHEENAKSNLEIMSYHLHELVAREKQLIYYYREAEQILDLFIKLSTSDLEHFAGNYWNKNESYARKIYVKNDTLRYYRNEDSENILMPISSNEFKMMNVGANVVIIKFDHKETPSMSVTINGGKQEILKVKN